MGDGTDLRGEGKAPFFSVVIPVLDGGPSFRLCLSALRDSTFTDWELIVVDDGSEDGSDRVARDFTDRVLSTDGRRGPAAARNLGARHAEGEFLFFVDADCSLHRDALGIAARELRSDPGVDALFGSYDDRPTGVGVVSRFKNLQHHQVHQSAEEEAETFWAGCGAFRRSRFLELGGFDAERFGRPSIEDIELGYRLRADGGRIRLAKDVQVTHHKIWTLATLVRTDLLDRGVPWVVLLSENRGSKSALNLSWSGRLSLVLGLVLPATLACSLWDGRFLAVALATAVAFAWINFRLFRLLWKRGGLTLLLAGALLLWMYQLVCALSLVLGVLTLRAGRGRGLRA